MKRNDDRNQFLFDVFVTALEGGIGYWSAASTYHNHTGTDDYGGDAIEDFYAVIHETKEGDDPEPDDEVVTDKLGYESRYQGQGMRVDADVIAKGLGLFRDKVSSGEIANPYAKQLVLADRTNGKDGDYDADMADIVVQLGLLGEVRYS